MRLMTMGAVLLLGNLGSARAIDPREVKDRPYPSAGLRPVFGEDLGPFGRGVNAPLTTRPEYHATNAAAGCPP